MLPIDRYLRNNSLTISAKIKGHKLIYLDIKYWLQLRDEAAHIDSGLIKLLPIVTGLVNSGKCLFPISDIVYYEVLKQQDEQTRRNTFELISKLSGGVAIIDDPKRIKLEFLDWIATGLQKSGYEAKDSVWGNLPTIIGYKDYAAVDYSGGSEKLQDAYFDFMSAMHLADITPDALLRNNPFTYKDNVDEFNANKKLYEHENKTFHQMFLSELGGMLDGASELLSAAMQEWFYYNTGRTATEAEIHNLGTQECRSLIYNLFKLDKMGDRLPFFKVCAEIYASFRWNKDRKYKDGNDTLDVMHAAAALPYCDYFFSERELCTIINQRKLGQLYNCKVASKPDEVLKLLQEI